MSRKLIIALGLVALVGAACRATVTNTATPKQTKTVHVIEHATTDVVTDVGKPGDSVGDILTFHNEVFDENNSSKVGTDQGECVRTDPKGGSWECWWTLFLSDGQITVEGPFSDNGGTVLAVTGGTGAYKDSAGEMQLKFHNEAGTEFDFIYELTG